MKGWDRPGHFDAAAHVTDMDVDGVDVEVVYCEVSAFRYLYQLGDAMEPVTRAFNDALARILASAKKHGVAPGIHVADAAQALRVAFAGVEVGDELTALNGTAPRDVAKHVPIIE